MCRPRHDRRARAGFNCAEAVNFGPPDWLPWGSYVADKYRAEGRSATLSHDALLVALVRAAPAVAARVAGKPWPDPTQKPDPSPAAPASPAAEEGARAAAPPAPECAGLRQQGLGYVKADAAPAPMPDPAAAEPLYQAAGAAPAGAGLRLVEQAGVPPCAAPGGAAAAELIAPLQPTAQVAMGREAERDGGGGVRAMDVDAPPAAAAAGVPPAAGEAGPPGPTGAGDADPNPGQGSAPVPAAVQQALAGSGALRDPEPGRVRVELQPRGDGVALRLSTGDVQVGVRY